MPRTSPVPMNSPRRGFTFVEVLVALVMCSLMIAGLTTALITVLKAEQQAAWLRDAQRMTTELSSQHYLGHSPTGLLSRTAADWDLTDELIRQTTEETTLVWRVWTLTPLDRPSLSIRLCLHEAASTNEW